MAWQRLQLHCARSPAHKLRPDKAYYINSTPCLHRVLYLGNRMSVTPRLWRTCTAGCTSQPQALARLLTLA